VNGLSANFTDDALERSLSDLGRHIAYPETPDLTATVRARIEASPRSHWWPWSERRRALAAVVLVFVAIASATLALSPAARRAVADWLGIGGIRIVQGGRSDAPVAEDLRLGEHVSLAEVEEETTFDVVVPARPDLHAPDEVYLDDVIPGGQVSLVYRAGADLPEAEQTGVGLLVTEFRSTLDETLVKKVVPSEATVEPAVVDGLPAFWIQGPHTLLYEDAEGDVREDRSRLAANVLIWEQDGVTIRLESALSKASALRIAESMR
jgi:hypothetical protein